MKTTTKLLAGLLVILMMTTLLASCGSKSIVGTWETTGGGMTYEFKADGTYSYTALGVTNEGTYTVKDGKINMDGMSSFDYTVKGDKLIFSVAGVTTMEFTKKG